MTRARLRQQLRTAKREEREKRRREKFAILTAKAAKPAQLIGYAADHLRAIVADLPPAAADRITTRTIAALNQLIEDAYREEKRQ